MDELEITTGGGAQATAGSAGLETQQAAQATTVSGLSQPGGGIAPGNLFETDIDRDLFEFESDDTPLLAASLKSKTMKVESPVVQHFAIDEERTSFATAAAVTASSSLNQFTLNVGDARNLCSIGKTLRCRGIRGWLPNGSAQTGHGDLILYVVGKDTTSGNPIVAAINGPKTNVTDELCTVPAIPANTTIDVLANAAYETQRWAQPDACQPVPKLVYCQKSVLAQIISDYFDSQKKRIPFAKGVIAEAMIRKFKRERNRTLWVGVGGHRTIEVEKLGAQDVYFTEGIRWQFTREVEHSSSKWTYEEFIALAKMLKTGPDSVNGATVYCGKNALEAIQCIDFSKHHEVKIESTLDGTFGWKLYTITTVFGDLKFIHEPTFDRIGYSNSMAVIGDNRLVRYVRATEHSESERIDGHEANMESTIIWDGIALKGTCHIFVNGEGTASAAGAEVYRMVGADDLTTSGSDTNVFTPSGSGTVIYYFTVDAKYGSVNIRAGETWKWDGTSLTAYSGLIAA